MLIVVVEAMAMKSMMALSTVTNLAMMMKGIVITYVPRYVRMVMMALILAMFMVVTQSTYLCW